METSDYITMYWSANEMAVQGLTIYLTVITGYLIATYFIGAKLSKSQSLFISGYFYCFRVLLVVGSQSVLVNRL